MKRRGFTLVEVLVVLAVAGILAGITLPASLSYLQKSRRSDAISALTRLQFAQERFHALHGLYAADLRQLAMPPRSDSGYYELQLQQVEGERFTAVAVARVDGPQAGDLACQQITLAVVQGAPEPGPTANCWNR